MQHGGVVAVAEVDADFLVGEAGVLTREVHGEMAGAGGALILALGGERLRRDAGRFAGGVDDFADGGRLALDLLEVVALKRADDEVDRDGRALGLGQQADVVEGAFEVAHIARGAVGDHAQHGFIGLHAALGAFLQQNRQAQFDVGLGDFGD